MIKLFFDNYGDLISIILAIISIVITVIFRQIDKKRLIPYFILKTVPIKNDEIIEHRISKIIEENNHLVLSKTSLLFFNGGNGTLKIDDFGKKTGLCLSFSQGTKIFSIQEESTSSRNVNLKYRINSSEIRFNFDYLKKDGFFKVNVISDEKYKNQVKLDGELKNDIQIKQFSKYNFYKKRYLYYSKYIFVSVLFVACIDYLFDLGYLVVFLFGLIVGFLIPDFFDFSSRNSISKQISKFF